MEQQQQGDDQDDDDEEEDDDDDERQRTEGQDTLTSSEGNVPLKNMDAWAKGLGSRTLVDQAEGGGRATSVWKEGKDEMKEMRAREERLKAEVSNCFRIQFKA